MRQKGFSIIEVLIATTLVGTVILGVLGLLGGAIKTSAQSNNMFVASMLAQEGIELVMNIRDTNWIEGSDWRDELGHPGNFQAQAGVTYYNYNDPNPISILYAGNIAGCGPFSELYEEKIDIFFGCDETILYLNSDNFYIHDSVDAAETKYRRIVIIVREKDSDIKDRLIVTSIVRWGEPTDRGKEVRLVTVLYDWID